ncbi:acyltransferase [Escherichia coli]|nr:acyltransferase [Escherichia coli]
MKRIESLDSLRGVCALLVMLFHIRIYGTVTETGLARNAYCFVDFFFILSGFVITMVYEKSNYGFLEFAKKRFFRIYPLFFFMMTASVIAEFIKYFAHSKLGMDFGSTPFSEGSSPSFIPYYYTLTQAWLPWVQSDGFLYPSWSISIELYMYIFLYVMLSSTRNFYLSITIMVAVLIYYLFSSNGKYPNDVIRGLICIPLGAIAYHAHIRIKHTKAMEIIAIIACYVSVSYEFDYKFIAVITSFLFCIVVFSKNNGILSSVLNTPPMVYLGKLSYSIYLTHALVLYAFVLASIIIGKITGLSFSSYSGSARVINFGNDLFNYAFLLLAIVSTVAVSHLTFNYIEKPFMKFYKRKDTKAVA